jgi:predicted nucleotidyltransferase
MTRYSLEEALAYLRDFLRELNKLNSQIIEIGNTPELLEEVHKKYTALWLFQLYFYVDNLPRVIGRLWRCPDER